MGWDLEPFFKTPTVGLEEVSPPKHECVGPPENAAVGCSLPARSILVSCERVLQPPKTANAIWVGGGVSAKVCGVGVYC